MCTPAHQKSMLNIIRGRLYISELIYAQGDHFCALRRWCHPLPILCRPQTINVRRISPSITTAIPFFAGYRMTYIQRGNYVAVINPLSYSEVMSDDPDLSRGVYDTVTDTFSPPAKRQILRNSAPLVRGEASTFQQDDRFYTIVHSEKRPIAIIVSTSRQPRKSDFYHEAALTIPFGIICIILILLMWWRTRRNTYLPGAY